MNTKICNVSTIDKIVKKLKSTKLGFLKGRLKSSMSCSYCAEGVLAKGHVPKKELYRNSSLSSIAEDNEKFKQKMKQIYGVDFTERYKEPIDCIYCSYSHSVVNLNQLIYHINDHHSSSHSETANKLERFNKEYDLVTGKQR